MEDNDDYDERFAEENGENTGAPNIELLNKANSNYNPNLNLNNQPQPQLKPPVNNQEGNKIFSNDMNVSPGNNLINSIHVSKELHPMDNFSNINYGNKIR